MTCPSQASAGGNQRGSMEGIRSDARRLALSVLPALPRLWDDVPNRLHLTAVGLHLVRRSVAAGIDRPYTVLPVEHMVR